MARLTPIMLFLLLPALFLSSGCGTSAAPVAEVSGVVTKNGQPLADISVQFEPDPEKGTFGPISAGTTDESGHYEATCIDERPGAVVGWNRVVLKDMMPRPRRAIRVGRDEEDTPEAQKVSKGARTAPSRVPDKYTSSAHTPLIVEVKPEKQEMNFDLSR
jgi:hypothetical protein